MSKIFEPLDPRVVNGNVHDLPSDEGDDADGFITSFATYRHLKRFLDDIAQYGIEEPYFQPRHGVSGSMIEWHGRSLINYSGYNYLGLSGHPKVNAAAKVAIDQYGTSASASRIVSGQIGLHGELEKRLAVFLGTEDALVFVSGYLTNVSVIGHLLHRPDAAIYDCFQHNSILTGVKLSGARSLTYSRGDWKALDATLAGCRSEFRRGLLIGEGVYSMDGTIFDIHQAILLKQRHDLLLMVDEAHSLGVLGKGGRGVCDHFGAPTKNIDIHMGTLSKALASCGGYIAGDHEMVDYLRYLAPGLLYSVGLSPPDTAAALAALDVLESEPHRVKDLRQRIHSFRRLAQKWGIAMVGDEDAPVASLVVGDDARCMLLSQRLLEHGIHVQPIVYPAVAPNSALLRFFITINHTEEQFLATMPAIAKELETMGQLAS